MRESTDPTACVVQVTATEQGHWDIQGEVNGVRLRVFTDRRIVVTLTWRGARHLLAALQAALAEAAPQAPRSVENG